jgi:hypothetical protein
MPLEALEELRDRLTELLAATRRADQREQQEDGGRAA